ncbi:MAG: HipA domain-containing protein [Kiritimatiellae bacterium]|nr:HipA domain-containing protein [Kiritimatiellia bacterium]
MTFCWICCRALGKGEERYHASCVRRLFGSNRPPLIEYTMDALNELAAQVVRRSVSVPGVQPKLSLHLEKSRGVRPCLKLTGLAGDFILKPAVSDYPGMPELEHLTMRLAELFHIPVASCGLIELADGARAYITRRMDRMKGGGCLHMEDMCQLTDKLTEQKYRGSMEQIGKAILLFSSHPQLDAQRLFEMTLFSFLTGNSDMHLKNFSLLYHPNGLVTLAPAYDLLAVHLLLSTDQEELALSMNGRKRRIQGADFKSFATHLRITDSQLDSIYARFRRTYPEALDFIGQGQIETMRQEEYRDLLRRRASQIGLC